MKTEITFQSLANDTIRPLRADASFTWLRELTPDQTLRSSGVSSVDEAVETVHESRLCAWGVRVQCTNRMPTVSEAERTRRSMRANRSKCEFTGRFKREWYPVLEGPQWALDLDAELAPPAHKWHARSNRKYWGGC